MQFSPCANRDVALCSFLDNAPSFSVGLLVTLICIVSLVIQYPSPFQRIGKPWLLSFLSGKGAMTFRMVEYVEKGYTKVIKKTGKPFVMKWWGMDHIFLPPKYLPDLQRANFHSLSFSQTIDDVFLLYASVGDRHSHSLMVDIVRKGINTRLPRLVPLLTEECGYAFTEEIGSPDSWTPFIAAELVSKIVHRTMSRIILGKVLCRSVPYLNAAQSQADTLFINGLIMSMLPLGPLSRIMAYPFSIFYRMKLRKALDEIIPVVQERYNESKAQSQKDLFTQDAEKLDAIEWIMDLTRTDEKEFPPECIAATLLHTMWAGSPPSAGLVTQMVFQVLYEPQYLELLRSEAHAAFDTYGITEKALNNMPLMDSFIREVNRLYPTGAVNCARTVMDREGFRFHDGLELPVGARVVVPTLPIQTDPENFADPLTFDGFRFVRSTATEETDDAAEHADQSCRTAAAISKTNLAFGYGKHACIGRFYAVRMVKLIFGKLITEYDMKWDGVKTRPPSLALNAQLAPNQSQQIYLKKRHSQ